MQFPLIIPVAVLGLAISGSTALGGCPSTGPDDICLIAQSNEIARPCEIYSTEGQCVKYADPLASIGVAVGAPQSSDAAEPQSPKGWWDRLFGN